MKENRKGSNNMENRGILNVKTKENCYITIEIELSDGTYILADDCMFTFTKAESESDIVKDNFTLLNKSCIDMEDDEFYENFTDFIHEEDEFAHRDVNTYNMYVDIIKKEFDKVYKNIA